MPDLPVMLRIDGKRCVIVGGGPVARRRAAALLEAGGEVTVVAPTVEPELAAMPVRMERRTYQPSDVTGAFLVVVATDDASLNDTIGRDARQAGALVNRADEPAEGDFTVPAHARHGPITVAVNTGGVSASAAAAIRRELSAALDPAWPRLLELVAPYRGRIRDATPEADARQAKLQRLTAPETMKLLKEQGPDAVRRLCESLVSPGAPTLGEIDAR